MTDTPRRLPVAEITGTITSQDRARLAGLEGVLAGDTVTWSNGVKWSKKASALVAPPSWAGSYHATIHKIDVRVSLKSGTQVQAASSSFKSNVPGHVSGEIGRASCRERV